MDAFERRKYSETAFFKLMLSNSVIVSYGTITAIDLDNVEVTLSVSTKNFADKINCTFMQLGNAQFSLSFKPEIDTQVVVFSPHKGAPEMYSSSKQIKAKTGKNFISTSSPSMYSSQQAFCFPLMKSTSLALSSLLIDNNVITLEVVHSLMASINGNVNLIINKDTVVELNEGTKHIRNCEGNLEQTFGMVQGISGTEKPGTYVYKETYGKFSSVEKNYESGIKTVIGKAYEKPFLESKGALVDSSAPVEIETGVEAPVTLKFGAPVNIAFGEDIITVSVDETAGINIAVTGAGKVSVTTETGLLKLGNSIGSLALIFSDLIAAIEGLVTVGGPTTQTMAPATVAALELVKTKIATILE